MARSPQHSPTSTAIVKWLLEVFLIIITAIQKRFSTLHPQRIEPDKRIVGKLFHTDSHEIKAPKYKLPGSKCPMNVSPASIKFHEKPKGCKNGWTKYFDHGVGRVVSVETIDDCTIDLSKLFLGHRFAHGAHSQLYHGVYNEEPIA
ncbi:Protein kinase superfamily protein [Forsythia ovata]|uniref:Protein kinase superfamily protein n=1 Tax=Forsythia ovata TaxID=205694 RepID=A0ABD1X0F5_9LAMI